MCDKADCKKAKPAAQPPQPLSCASVFGLQFDRGVLLAADSLVSFEGLALFCNAQRIVKVNESILLGGGNNFADLQYLQGVVEDKARGDPGLDPVTLEDFLRAGLYNRSIKATPLRLDLVLGGIVKGLPYLCMLDQRGYVCRDRVAATGFAAKMILPYLKNELAKRGEIKEQEARDLVKQSMQILARRHALAHPSYYVGIVDEKGAKVEKITL
ncbi:hypothetical protein M8J77_007042 [Diaphorina citri]|nr:hypothetical protein M8J77_007042 [Diaphorina citri]